MANYVLSYTGPEIDRAINFIQNQVAPVFSIEKTYKVGDIIIYNGLLYTCIVAKAPGAWDATKFELTKIFDDNGYLIINAGGSPAVEPQLVSITWTAAPTKTTYTVGETLDLAGGVVTAHYDDLTAETVTLRSTYYPTQGTVLAQGIDKVIATYNGKTAETAITVNPA